MTKDELETRNKELEQELNTLVSSNSNSQAELTKTMNDLAKAKEEIRVLKQQPNEVYELKAKIKALENKDNQGDRLQKILAVREKQLNKLVGLVNSLMGDRESQLQLDNKMHRYQSNEFEIMVGEFNDEIKEINNKGV